MPSDMKPDAVFELKLVFLRELDTAYRQARDDHERLLRNPADKVALKDLWNFFHKIAGTAHSVDLPLLAYLSAVCEDFLKLALDGNVTTLERLPRIIADALAGVATTLDSHGTKPSDRPLPSPVGFTQPDASGEE